MKHAFPLFALLSLSASAQNTHLLAAYDFAFDPLVLTVTSGDTIRLALGAGHSFREVPASAWYDNETTPIIGYDIGPFPEYDDTHYIVLTTPDTLYYICTAHLNMGMKGRIAVVEASIGTNESARPRYTWYPNPTHRTIFMTPAPGAPGLVQLNDMMGRAHYRMIAASGELDLQDLSPGLYVATLHDRRGRTVEHARITVE